MKDAGASFWSRSSSAFGVGAAGRIKMDERVRSLDHLIQGFVRLVYLPYFWDSLSSRWSSSLSFKLSESCFRSFGVKSAFMYF